MVVVVHQMMGQIETGRTEADHQHGSAAFVARNEAAQSELSTVTTAKAPITQSVSITPAPAPERRDASLPSTSERSA